MDLKKTKTNNQNPDFIMLIKLLDADLDERYGELQKQYKKHNKADHMHYIFIVSRLAIATSMALPLLFQKYGFRLFGGYFLLIYLLWICLVLSLSPFLLRYYNEERLCRIHSLGGKHRQGERL